MVIGTATIIMKVLFAILEFEILPLYDKVIKKEKFSEKRAAFHAIFNSIFMYIAFLVIQYAIFHSEDKNDILIYFIVGYVCGLINYYWLKAK